MKKEENLRYKKEGLALKIKIIRKGFRDQKHFAEYSGISHAMIRDYTCGKKIPSKASQSLILSALNKPPTT